MKLKALSLLIICAFFASVVSCSPEPANDPTGGPTITVDGATYMVTATALPETALNKSLYWTSSDETVATVSGGYIWAVGEGTATLRATAVSGVYAECTMTVGVPRENDHEYVDLGLPSGLMWATCNVGAENDDPNANGAYYAWGEIVTKKVQVQDIGEHRELGLPIRAVFDPNLFIE